jgi:RimJ/RimL family protein N-acetyltransferase
VNLPATITDGSVVLRPVREDDRAVVLSAMSDPLVARWLNMPRTPSNADFDSLVRVAEAGWSSGGRFDYAVCLANDPTWRGAVIASRRHRDNYEVAYLAGPEGRARGVMSTAVRLLCDALFAAGAGRLELRTHPENEPSQRLAERCGFQREGRERRSIWLHGNREDALVWSLLPDDPR